MIEHDVYIALGSNLDNPAQQLDLALEAISKLPDTELIDVSSYFQTLPMGYSDQDNFLNAVCYVQTALSPFEMLSQLQAIEQAQARVRLIKNGPRTIDCDLLMYDEVELQTDKLTLPHPGMLERDFVLLPLCEIAPDLVLPNGKTVTQHIDETQLNSTVISTPDNTIYH